MLDDKKKEIIEEFVKNGNIVYAYYYPLDGSERQVFVFLKTPENIANFLGSHQFDAKEMIITDILDMLVLNTFGGFINRCPDQKLCAEILKYLAPIQMGEKEVKEFPIVTMEEWFEYGDLCDE